MNRLITPLLLLSFFSFSWGQKTISTVPEMQLSRAFDSLHKFISIESQACASDINHRIDIIKANIDKAPEYTKTIYWISGFAVSLVALLFAISSIFVIVRNSTLMRESRRRLRECEKESRKKLRECELIKKDMANWFKEQKNSYQEFTTALNKQSRILVRNASYADILNDYLRKDKEKISIELVFPLISTLANPPSIEYGWLFKKVLELNLSADINQIANTALESLKL